MEESLGQLLREAREEKELSLEEISKELHIRVQYLKALEENSPESIPSSVQARGFLRSYSNFLGFTAKDLTDIPLPVSDQVPTSDKIKQLNIQRSASINPESSTLLFGEIGKSLKTRRDVLGLSKEDIEDHTHIPTHYVTFMESGEFDQFPSPAQARGMLTNYVSFLDVPPDEIMLKYAEALQLELSARQAVPERDQNAQKGSGISRRFSFPRTSSFPRRGCPWTIPSWPRPGGWGSRSSAKSSWPTASLPFPSWP